MSVKFSICFVCPEAYPVLRKTEHVVAGGAELQQVILAKEFAKRGYRVSFVAGDYGQSEIEYIDGIKVIRSYKVGYGNRKLRFIADCQKMFKAMIIADAEIYYQRCVFHQTGKVAIFAKLHKKRFVFSLGHDMNACSPFELKGLNPIYKFSYIWAIKKTDLIISQNMQQRQNLLAHYKRDSYIVPNVIEDIQYHNSIRKHNDLLVLWVGTFSERKQPLFFAKIARHFNEGEFWMIGIPSDQRLLDAAQQYGERYNNLKIIGFVEQHKIHEYFSQADIFVSTALSEGFPNTFLQAWAHSIPVVSLNVNPDGVLEKSGGGIYCNGNMDLVISHIKDLLKDEEKRCHMGKMGLEYANKYHKPDKVIPMYTELFDKLLSRRSKGNQGNR